MTTDLIEKVARLCCCGGGDCSAAVHGEEACELDALDEMQASRIIQTVLREMMEPYTDRLDLVLHDLGTPNPKERKQWCRDFYELMVKAFAQQHSIELGDEDGR